LQRDAARPGNRFDHGAPKAHGSAAAGAREKHWENVGAFSSGALKTRAGHCLVSLTHPDNKRQNETVLKLRFEKEATD